MNELREALGDDLTWALSQVEVDVLLLSTKLGDTQSGYLGIAKQSADILLYHVNNVLDVARMDVGRLELIDDTFELTQFFKDIVTTNETTEYAHNNTLRLDLGDVSHCHAITDKQRLQQVPTTWSAPR